MTGNPVGSTAKANPGYYFKNWTEFNNGTSVSNDATLKKTDIDAIAKSGSSYAATTFVANFAPDTYTVTFNANEGTGSMNNQPMAYGQAANLTSNAFTRAGYTFAGWNTLADGLGKAYADGASVSNLTTEKDGSVTLYAQWTELPKVSVSYRPSNSAMGNVSMESESLNPETGTAVGSTAAANSGYRFVNWTKDGTVITTDAALTAELVNANAKEAEKYVSTTFVANFVSAGGGSEDSSGGSSTPTVTVPISSDAGKADVSAAVSGSTVNVTVTDTQLGTVISSAQTTGTVTVDVSALKNVDSAMLPAKLVKAAAEAAGFQGLEVKLPTGTVELDATALAAVNSDKDLAVSVAEVKNDSLTGTQKATLGNQTGTATIVDVYVLVNGAKQSDYNGGTLTISIPYTLKAGESADSVVVWFLRDDGTLEPHAATYKNGMLTFTTTHLSRYVIASFPFADVTLSDYFYKAVLWAAEKGITGGTSATTFSPNAVCSRAQIVTFQYRAAGKPAVGTVDPFTDVASGSYYESAVLWAVKEGVTQGTTTTTFSPNADCTRAQIVTFLFRQLGK